MYAIMEQNHHMGLLKSNIIWVNQDKHQCDRLLLQAISAKLNTCNIKAIPNIIEVNKWISVYGNKIHHQCSNCLNSISTISLQNHHSCILFNANKIFFKCMACSTFSQPNSYEWYLQLKFLCIHSIPSEGTSMLLRCPLIGGNEMRWEGIEW